MLEPEAQKGDSTTVAIPWSKDSRQEADGPPEMRKELLGPAAQEIIDHSPGYTQSLDLRQGPNIGIPAPSTSFDFSGATFKVTTES